MKLFDNLVGKVEKVLEIGVGTGPNFKYYSVIPNVSVPVIAFPLIFFCY